MMPVKTRFIFFKGGAWLFVRDLSFRNNEGKTEQPKDYFDLFWKKYFIK